MRLRVMIILGLCSIILGCQKEILLKQGFTELESFYWEVNAEENRLNFRIWLVDTEMDSITDIVVKADIDGIKLDRAYSNPTVILDTDTSSVKYGLKCIEDFWIPAIETTDENVNEIRIFVK